MAGDGKDINESEVLKFVDAYIDSFIVWDIILFYYHNPTAVESVSSLATRLGRIDKDVKSSVNDLVKRDILTANDGGTYLFSPAPELASGIEGFCEALSVSSLRLAILSQVLSKGKARPWKNE
jgi:hypothetical protein